MTPAGHTYPHPSGDGGTQAALAWRGHPWAERAGRRGPVTNKWLSGSPPLGSGPTISPPRPPYIGVPPGCGGGITCIKPLDPDPWGVPIPSWPVQHWWDSGASTALGVYRP